MGISGNRESRPPLPEATLVTVVVPTRDRPVHALACTRAILALDGFLHLIVVDQSEDTATEEALLEIHDRRLRYVRTQTRGVTRGRNLGIELSNSDVVAFTDDDCRARSDWIRRIVDVFTGDPDVAAVCGTVHVPEAIRHLGWAESFQPRRRVWQGRYPPIGEWGITANLSVRRSVIERVGPFDPMLGAGSPLRSGGEPDLLFRILRAGFKVVNAAEVWVDHVGLRDRDESRALLQGYGIGTAAAFMKNVRLGEPAAAMVLARLLGATILRVSSRVILLKRPTGAGFLLAFLSGALRSFRYRIDRRRRQYVEA